MPFATLTQEHDSGNWQHELYGHYALALLSMILGIGVDLVEMERIREAWRRFGPRFAARITGGEELPQGEGKIITFLAGRFAAAEAAVKALGTGFSNGITMAMIGVRKSHTGAPYLFFKDKALDMAALMGVDYCHLSISHERALAIAMVILEKK